MDKWVALKQGTGTHCLFHETNYKLTVEAISALLSQCAQLVQEALLSKGGVRAHSTG